MASTYLKLTNLEIVPIKNIVLLPTQYSAELYFEKIFDLFIDCIIVTIDKTYPLNPDLGDNVWEKLENDEDLNIVVFGYDCLSKIKIKSKKIFVLDDILLSDFDKTLLDSSSLDINEYKIFLIIKSFFDQDKKIKMSNRISSEYTRLKRYRNDTNNNWILTLLTGKKND